MEKNLARPRPLRSVLYLPASNERAIEKARALPADAVVFDLEDAVAPAARSQARRQLSDAFAKGGFGRSLTVIRTNTIGSPDCRDDLAVVAQCRPDAVLLPKVSSAEEVNAFARDAQAAGLAPQTTCWFMVETVAGLVNLSEIIRAGLATRPRLDALVVGTNDIAKETGASADDERRYLLPWLMQVVLTAKHYRVSVLDGVWNDFRNTAGFESEARQAQKMGFDGKTLIHPTQVEPANAIFSPSPAALDEARAIVDAFDRPENADAGVINLGGKMVERLHLAQAVRLLAIAEQAQADR